MGKHRHLLLQVFALAIRATGLAATHDKSFEFLAAGSADEIK